MKLEENFEWLSLPISETEFLKSFAIIFTLAKRTRRQKKEETAAPTNFCLFRFAFYVMNSFSLFAQKSRAAAGPAVATRKHWMAVNPLCQHKLTNGIAFEHFLCCMAVRPKRMREREKKVSGRIRYESIDRVASACIVIACWHQSGIQTELDVVFPSIPSHSQKHQCENDYENYWCSGAFNFSWILRPGSRKKQTLIKFHFFDLCIVSHWIAKYPNRQSEKISQ